ncbi:MAG: metallophosphoesterase [Cyanobacteriota bacterium]
MQEETKITRRTFLRNCAIAAGATGAITYGTYIASNSLELTTTSIKTNKLSSPIKILLFSDIHLCPQSQPQILKNFINTVCSIKPDIICYTGDTITHSTDYISVIKDIFSRFSSKYGNFAVVGNHDYNDGNKAQTIISNLQAANFIVLKNNMLKLNVKDNQITIYGLDDLWDGIQDLPLLFKDLNVTDFNLVLTHNPSNIEDISKYNPDMVLAGHTHGGQIYIPYLLNGIYKNLYDPRFIRGLYTVNQTRLYVNRGIGSTLTALKAFNNYYKIPAIRLFATPEVSILNLT